MGRDGFLGKGVPATKTTVPKGELVMSVLGGLIVGFAVLAVLGSGLVVLAACRRAGIADRVHEMDHTADPMSTEMWIDFEKAAQS